MAEESPRGSPARRLSQIFDPLSRLSEYTQQQQLQQHTQETSSIGRIPAPRGNLLSDMNLSHSTPSSPRLMPRRIRTPAQQQPMQQPLQPMQHSPLHVLHQLMPSSVPPTPPPRPQPHSALDALDSELSWRSTSSPDAGVNWQERCLELQLELHRSRSQATRVRDMLRDKVG